MVEVRVVKPMWRSKKTDLIPGIAAFISCLVLPLELGILVGIGLNILFILYHASRPKIHMEKIIVSLTPVPQFSVSSRSIPTDTCKGHQIPSADAWPLSHLPFSWLRKKSHQQTGIKVPGTCGNWLHTHLWRWLHCSQSCGHLTERLQPAKAADFILQSQAIRLFSFRGCWLGLQTVLRLRGARKGHRRDEYWVHVKQQQLESNNQHDCHRRICLIIRIYIFKGFSAT